MIIKKIYIDGFGKLKDFSLDLKQGINAIYGHNEAGKSTIMAFIQMMFYGNKGSQRKKDPASNPRIKYRPWDGSPMQGYIIYEKFGKEYRLERIFDQTNKKDQVSIFDNLTGDKIDLINIQEPGEEIFNMDLETFVKSYFIDSEKMDFSNDNNAHLNERLTNLITTRDEDVSLGKSLAKLEKIQYDLLSKREDKGLIADQRNLISDFKKRLKIAKDLESEKKALEEDLKQLEDLVRLEKEKDKYYRYILQSENAKALSDDNDKRKDLEFKLKSYEEERAFLQTKLDKLSKDYQKNLQMIDEDKELKNTFIKDLDVLKNSQRKKDAINDKLTLYEEKSSKGLIISGLALGGGLASYLLKLPLYLLPIFIIVILYGIFDYLANKKREAKIRTELMSLSDIDNKVNAKEKELRDLLAGLDDLRNTNARISADLRMVEIEQDNLEKQNKDSKRELKKLQENKIYMSIDPRIFENTQRQLNQLKEKIDLMESDYKALYPNSKEYFSGNEENRLLHISSIFEKKNAYANERFKNAEYVDSVQYKLDKAEAKLKELEEQRGLVIETISFLKAASNDLDKNFLPKLNSSVAEIFSNLTKNKYDKVLINKDYKIKVQDNKQNQLKDWDYLSAATKDQAYLSLKIALAKVLANGQKGILLLDDIFIKYDINRVREGVGLLVDLLNDFDQIIFFTCQKTVFDLLDEKDYESVNKIYI